MMGNFSPLMILLGLIVAVNAYFVIILIRDLARHWQEMKQEPANAKILPVTSPIIFFLSTFGISDFAISSALYPKLKWLSIKKLPGTLNTQCVVPVAVMALCYISVISVDIKTLIVCIVCQVLGAYLGPRYVVRLPANIIKTFIVVGLSVAVLMIIAGKFNWIPSGGDLTGLEGSKLVIAGVLLFCFGALNNIGIGSYALTMVTVYALGMDPAVAFPIMMGAATFSVPVASVQFIKFEQYSRKITLFTSTVGVLGVLAAVYLVKSLDTNMLQWLVVAVLIYTIVDMALSLSKRSEEK